MSHPDENEKEESRLERARNAPSLTPSDFALLFLTCLGAPLTAHVCDLLFGAENNPLSSDKLLCAYFALVALEVLWENFFRAYQKTKLWEDGWRLGGSDAVLIALFVVVASVVLVYYDTLPGAVAVIALFLVFFVLLLFKIITLRINSWMMILIALMVAVIVPGVLLGVFGGEQFYSVVGLVRYFVGTVIVVFLFDAVAVLGKRLRNYLGRRKEERGGKC